MTLGKLLNQQGADEFLRGLGLATPELVVRQVVDVLRGKTDRTLFQLYSRRVDKQGRERIPVCGKGTAYKIKKLYDQGRLAPYMTYLDSAAERDTGADSTASLEEAAGLLTSSQRQETEETPDIGQEFRVWCGGSNFSCVRVVLVESIPPSSRSVVAFGPLEAEAEVTKVAADALGIEPRALVRMKIEVLDNVAVRVVEPDTEGPTSGWGLGHGVDAYTPSTGRGSEGAWFWLYGENRELSLRVRNPMKYRTPASRVRFSGWRAVTEPVDQPRGSVIEAVSRGWS